MKTARFIRSGISQSGAEWRLYHVNEPIEFENDEGSHTTNYIVVSAVVAIYTGPETYIFPADEHGAIVNWRELRGSFRGGLDHCAALAAADYDATEADPAE